MSGIFVGGYGSGAGKSTFCLGLIHYLLHGTKPLSQVLRERKKSSEETSSASSQQQQGDATTTKATVEPKFDYSEVAYIKPVTQCEAVTDVVLYCQYFGV